MKEKKETKSKEKSASSNSASNKKQIQLSKLQDILIESYKLESLVNDIPTKIESKKNQVNMKKAQLLSSIEHLNKVTNYIKTNKEELLTKTKTRQELEDKQEKVSSTREYDNNEITIEKLKKDEKAIKENLSNLEKRKDAISQNVSKLEAEIEECKVNVDSEIKKLEEELSKAKEDLEKAKEKKDKLSKDIDNQFLFKFERIVKSKGGLASVSLINGVCQGCHMQLPDEFVNKVRENSEIHFCPYCSRILVWKSSEIDEEISRSNEAYKNKVQQEEQKEFEKEADADEIQEDNNPSINISIEDDELDSDTIDDYSLKDEQVKQSLIADESEFDL